MLARLIAFVRGVLARARVDREVDDELRFHLQQEIEANLLRGFSPAEARRRALADLGGLSGTADAIRDVRSLPLSRLRLDLRDALRGLRAGRGTTALAFSILTLTMAAATVTFSVVDAVAIRSLPYGSPDRLVGLSLPTTTPGRGMPVSPKAYFDWLEGTRSFESLGAARTSSGLQLHFDGLIETLGMRRVTANLFDMLDVQPAAGRFFSPEHGTAGRDDVVILSHELWVRRFSADPDIIGQRLRFDDGTREVLGVLPEHVSFPIMLSSAPELYVPYVLTAADRANDRCCIFVVGRLKPGVTFEQARADVERMGSVLALRLHDQVVGPAKSWLVLVLAAVGLVLLVACANVGSLLLARAATRARELAAREALGASRRRLAIGLLFEGLLLALVSAAAATVLSLWGVEIARASLPPGLTRVEDIAVDGRVLSACILVAVLCGLSFASAPAWLSRKNDLVGLLKTGGGALIGDRRRNRSLTAFLVADVAFVSVLLVATALVVTTFVLVTTADLGFDRRNVMTVSYQRSLEEVPEADRPAVAATLRAEMLERVNAVPGVMQAAIVTNAGAPLGSGFVRYSITIPGVGETSRDDWLETRMVTPDYFQVMDMQLTRGRLFDAADRAGAPLVMLINDVAARRFFGDRDPVGQVVTFRSPTTIIGVLRGVHARGPEVETQPEMYIPADQEAPRYQQRPLTHGQVVVRTSADPRGLAAAIRDAIRPTLDREPGQPQFVDDNFRAITATRRFNAGVMGIFGLIAVAIGATGVYGTLAFFVAQQVRSIGLRMALGASPADVRRSVLGGALRRVALGVTIGLVGAWMTSSALEAFVFGIRPTEPAVYVAVAGFLGLVGLGAALVPAWRASRLDPLAALRDE